jgi:thiamine monophosphate synthase
MIAAIAILTLNALAVLPQILEGGTLADQVPRLIDVGVWLVATVLLLWPNRNAVPRETESSAQ